MRRIIAFGYNKQLHILTDRDQTSSYRHRREQADSLLEEVTGCYRGPYYPVYA